MNNEIKVTALEPLGPVEKVPSGYGRQMEFAQRCRAVLADGTEVSLRMTARRKKDLPGLIASWSTRAWYDPQSKIFSVVYGV